MKRWFLRHKVFKISFFGVVFSSILFVIGFAAPAWRNTTGLWLDCIPSHKMCVSHSSPHNTLSLARSSRLQEAMSRPFLCFKSWFEAVQGFECMAFIAIVLCIGAEIYMDCVTQPSPDKRLVEAFALIAGTLGLVGCIIFAAFTPISRRTLGGYYDKIQLSWGFGLTTASCSLLIAFASVIAFFRHRGLDAVRYEGSDAVHYRASDGTVISEGFNGMDAAPPPYTEVVSQSGSQTGGSSGPNPPSQFAYYKPPEPLDSEPPPAYYPPPAGGHIDAPPPYAAAPTQSAVSGSSRQNSSSEFPVTQEANPRSVEMQPGGNMADLGDVSFTPIPAAADSVSPESQLFHPVSPADQRTVMSSLPAYYVTVLGQTVPVYLDELQQAGREAPSPTAIVPAYFIMINGQHVPVYNEEQTREISS